MRPFARCVDDRGQKRGFDRREPKRSARRAGVDPSVIKAELRPLRQLAWIQFLLTVTAIILFGRAQDLLMSHVPAVQRWIIIVLAMLGLMAIGLMPITARLYRAQRRAGLALGFCPSCGYPVTGLKVQNDGCRVCPECGSAWRMDDPIESMVRRHKRKSVTG